jgi:hypothetical protein
MNLEQILAGAVPRQWVTRQAIILDWNAGPRTGVCALSQPRCEFFFHLFAEPLEGDLLAIRLFAVSELRAGVVAQIEALLYTLGRPVGPLWVPVWKFSDESMRREIEGCLDALLVAARPTALLAATGDWLHFDGCWNADRIRSVQSRSPARKP